MAGNNVPVASVFLMDIRQFYPHRREAHVNTLCFTLLFGIQFAEVAMLRRTSIAQMAFEHGLQLGFAERFHEIIVHARIQAALTVAADGIGG